MLELDVTSMRENGTWPRFVIVMLVVRGAMPCCLSRRTVNGVDPTLLTVMDCVATEPEELLSDIKIVFGPGTNGTSFTKNCPDASSVAMIPLTMTALLPAACA